MTRRSCVTLKSRLLAVSCHISGHGNRRINIQLIDPTQAFRHHDIRLPATEHGICLLRHIFDDVRVKMLHRNWVLLHCCHHLIRHLVRHLLVRHLVRWHARYLRLEIPSHRCCCWYVQLRTNLRRISCDNNRIGRLVCHSWLEGYREDRRYGIEGRL